MPEELIKLEGYPATLVAREFWDLGKADGKTLTQLQLMKMAYIAHGYSLAYFDRPLVSETAEAWLYGPVFPSLYEETKQFGTSTPVEEITAEHVGVELDRHQKILIGEVYRVYREFSGIELSDMTHQSDTPWFLNFIDFEKREISNDDIRDYYMKLRERSRRRAASSQREHREGEGNV